MGLLQAVDSLLCGILGTGGVSERVRRVVRAAYAVFAVFVAAEVVIAVTGAELPGVLAPAVHALAALSLVSALGAGITYYVGTGSVWPAA